MPFAVVAELASPTESGGATNAAEADPDTAARPQVTGESVMFSDFDRRVAEPQIAATIMNGFTTLETPTKQRAG